MSDGSVKKKRGGPTKRRSPPKGPRGDITPRAKGITNRHGDEDGILNERQRLFVNHVVRDKMNLTAAARLAGYSTTGASANQLMTSPKIQKAIAIEREEFARASQMTKKKVIDGFMEAIDMARMKADPMVMVAGWREVAKMCGYYEPVKHKLEVSVNGEVVIQKLQALDDAQLLALADGRTDTIDGEFTVLEAPSDKP